mgnify:CR=1 FL=1
MMDLLSTFLLDAVVTRAFASTLAIILLVGGWQKLREPEVFAAAIENYRVLPEVLVHPFARLLPVLELAAGITLLFPASCEWGGLIAAAVMLAVTGVVVINLWRGQRAIDCGCGGMPSKRGCPAAAVAAASSAPGVVDVRVRNEAEAVAARAKGAQAPAQAPEGACLAAFLHAIAPSSARERGSAGTRWPCQGTAQRQPWASRRSSLTFCIHTRARASSTCSSIRSAAEGAG